MSLQANPSWDACVARAHQPEGGTLTERLGLIQQREAQVAAGRRVAEAQAISASPEAAAARAKHAAELAELRARGAALIAEQNARGIFLVGDPGYAESVRDRRFGTPNVPEHRFGKPA